MFRISYTRKQIFRMILVFFSYLVTAQVFFHLYASVPTSPALIWPASGIALAALILGGIALWPAVLLASLVHQLMSGAVLTIAIGIAIANALQPIVATLILRSAGFTNSFSRVRDTIAFILVALLVTLIVPALGSLSFLVAGEPFPRSFAGTFVPWWIGHIVSALIITPLLIRWIPRFTFRRSRIELMEAAVALLTVVAVSLFLYWTPYREAADIPLIYLILIPFLWIALRIGPRFMTLALFINAGLALGGTAFLVVASGDVAGLGSALLQTEIFIIIVSLLFLLLVTVAEERKDTANDLRENVRRLEDAIERIRKEDEAKSRFIATLAHELRNPLAPLMSSLEIMKLEQVDQSRIEELSDHMTGHLKTMRHLLDDLLDISRISRAKLTLQKEHVDLHAVINRSLRTVKEFIDEREHTLVTDLTDDAVRFDADPVRLEQVLVNLLNNAAKYTEPGGTITLSAHVRDTHVIISVKDTGIGMDTNVLEHVFEPFYQIEQPGKLHSGLGIGLSLTRNLVEMHDGTIEAKSQGQGLGSEFIVRLPLPHTKSPQGFPNDLPEPMEKKDSLRILIVDDNKAAADALVRLLALRGHETEASYLGQDAIMRAPEYGADVILLDIGLPDMEGYEVAHELRAAGVDATLIALTGYGQESDIKKAHKAGFAHHLTKPAGLAEIEEILDTVARA